MELVLLRRLVTELRPLLVGARTDRVYAAPRYDVVVASNGGRKHLWISVEPEDPHVCLRAIRPKSDSRPLAFAMAARKWSRGRRIEGLDLLNDDRVLRVDWQGGGALIGELVPRRATAFVVDDADRVVAVWNPRAGRPGIGDHYAAPQRTPRTAVADLAAATWTSLAALDDRRLRQELMRNIDGMAPSIVTEIIFRWRRGDGDLAAITGEVVQLAASTATPVLYAPAPIEQLPTVANGAKSGAAEVMIAPCPLEHRGDAHNMTFETVVAASQVFYDLRARLQLVERVTSAVERAIEERVRRLKRKRQAIGSVGDADVRSARLRRRADALLASPHASIVDGVASVADVYGDGNLIEIRVDPQLDLAANAHKLYRRAQRIEGAAQQALSGIGTIDNELVQLGALEVLLSTMRQPAEVQAILDQARQLGLRIPLEQLRNAEAGTGNLAAELPSRSRANLSGIMSLTTAAGHEILVGRSAKSNDRLTREVAARHDWWLHAEGPGSHVVLRNPRRLEQPPPDALAAAAALAAWFSKGRSAAKVEVHWTQARRVRKPRGAPAGAVLMDEFHSFVVQPRPPADVAADGGQPAD